MGAMTDGAADQSIVWSDDFLIGIEQLDYEHRCLIEDINKLHGELFAHADMGRIEDTLGSIHVRMQAHFALEESVMLTHKYPHYPEHKAEHERLLDEYAERRTTFERDRNLGDREAIQHILREWIVTHILTSDKKMSLMVTSSQQA
jgi:hemerythrin-like metal-binding protein